MGLEALLTQLESRTVTSVASAVTPDVTEKRTPIKECTAVTFVTAVGITNESTAMRIIEPAEFEERCGIIAENGHEISWVESAAVLFTMSCPTAFTPERWQQIVDDGGRFLDAWGRQAAALGWKAADVFGVCPESDAPECRYNGRGLVPSLMGRKVCDINKDTARIDCGGGITQTFSRKTMAADAVAVWAIGRK